MLSYLRRIRQQLFHSDWFSRNNLLVAQIFSAYGRETSMASIFSLYVIFFFELIPQLLS